MNQEPKISTSAHPLFASVLPGLGALACGLVDASCGAVAGYHFAYLFIPLQYPDLDDASLASAALFNVVLPWLCFFIGLVVGIVLMLIYRRNLRNHHKFLVERLLLSREEKRQQTRALQRIKIEWPLLLMALSCVGPLCAGSYQGGLIATSGVGGLFAGLLITYRERKEIYEDAFARKAERLRSCSARPLKAGLTRREKRLAVLLTVAILAFLASVVWSAAEITTWSL